MTTSVTMKVPVMRGLVAALLLGALSVPAVAEIARPGAGTELKIAQAPAGPAARAGGKRSSAFGELGSNREPIKIDADRLDVFDKEGRATFAGNVIAVQGDSTMKCSLLTVFYEAGRGAAAAGQPSAEPRANPLGGDNAIRKITCKGPVTIVSKTQVATGDNAEFDRARNKVLLVGNAALSDGPNVTRGERVAYDMNTGVASIEGGREGGRVRALIVPNSQAGAPANQKAR